MHEIGMLPIFVSPVILSALCLKNKKWRGAMTHAKSVCWMVSVLLLCMLISAGGAVAQPPGGAIGNTDAAGQMGGAPTGQQGGPGGMQRTQMDSAQMQQMMAQRYQELLGMSDEEWAVIGPYVLKVATLSQATQTRGSAMRTMMGGRGNTPGSDTGRNRSQDRNAPATQDQRGRGMMTGGGDENLQSLETLLEDENASSDEIKAKLSALRKSREASKQELIAAQKELRELLTLRQEATLVVRGLLE